MKYDREDIRALPLALVGAAIGITEVYIRPYIQEKVQWLANLAIGNAPK